MAETLILPISAFPPWRKRHFSHFPLVRALGRTKTVKFGIDHTTGKPEIPTGGLRENNRPRALGRCGAWGRERFPQKKCQNKSACVPVSMRCKISRRSSCNQISSQSTSDTFLEQAAKACGIFYLIHVPAPFISEAVPSMYKGH